MPANVNCMPTQYTILLIMPYLIELGIYLFIGVLRRFQQYFSYITATVHDPWVNKPVLG